MIEEIQFKDIDASTSNYIAVVGLSIPDLDNENEKIKFFKELNDTLVSEGLLINGNEFTDIIRIKGNIKDIDNNDDFRHDFLFKLKTSIRDLNPIIRVSKFPFIKWVDDFKNNYKDDYLND